MKITFLTLLAFSFAHGGFAQQSQALGSSSLVVVFNADPSKFSTFQVDNQPIPANQVPKDFPSVWPVRSGTLDLMISAEGCENLQTSVQFSARKPTILLVDLVPNKDASTARSFPKQISVSARSLDLEFPKPDAKTAQVYAYVLEGPLLTGELSLGRAAPKKIQLPSKKLTQLGEGSLELSVSGRTVLSANPGNPGAYVFALLPDHGGTVRAFPFEFVVEAPEAKEVGDVSGAGNAASEPASP